MLFFAAEAEGGGLAFPSLDNLINWGKIIDFPGGDTFDLDKIGLTHFLGMLIPVAIFMIAGTQKGLVPTGVRGFVESLSLIHI